MSVDDSAQQVRQRRYYAETAKSYDAMHVSDTGEHVFALAFMLGMIRHYGFASALDVGSGTGRALLKIKECEPLVTLVGVEPSKELRELGHSKGIKEIIEGDAQQLHFEDKSFDLVCAFGVLHHVPHPRKAVSEMLRVAKRAIFISDSNNFGQGGGAIRLAKQTIHALGLWRVADFIKTRGRGYIISDGDGLSYSYSLFNDYSQIAAQCQQVHLINTVGKSANPYRSSPNVAIFGLK